MDRNAANSYIYARACGKLAKSFTGEKVNSLFDAKTLSELWTLLFSSQPPVMPEVLLAQEIEKQAFANLIKTYSTFIFPSTLEPMVSLNICSFSRFMINTTFVNPALTAS